MYSVSKNIKEKQIKSKKRVVEHGEVFTAEREVNAMLDLVEPVISGIDTTVLEPAVGEGAFLIQILKRRLDTISAYHISDRAKQWQILKAVSSLYGVDIQADNVAICRNKLKDCVCRYLKQEDIQLEKGFIKGLNEILKRNVVCGNTLSAKTSDNSDLTFSEWHFEPDGRIYRMEYTYRELLDKGGECTAKRRRHTYSWMVDHDSPARAAMELENV